MEKKSLLIKEYKTNEYKEIFEAVFENNTFKTVLCWLSMETKYFFEQEDDEKKPIWVMMIKMFKKDFKEKFQDLKIEEIIKDFIEIKKNYPPIHKPFIGRNYESKKVLQYVISKFFPVFESWRNLEEVSQPLIVQNFTNMGINVGKFQVK